MQNTLKIYNVFIDEHNNEGFEIKYTLQANKYIVDIKSFAFGTGIKNPININLLENKYDYMNSGEIKRWEKKTELHKEF